MPLGTVLFKSLGSGLSTCEVPDGRRSTFKGPVIPFCVSSKSARFTRTPLAFPVGTVFSPVFGKSVGLEGANGSLYGKSLEVPGRRGYLVFADNKVGFLAGWPASVDVLSVLLIPVVPPELVVAASPPVVLCEGGGVLLAFFLIKLGHDYFDFLVPTSF